MGLLLRSSNLKRELGEITPDSVRGENNFWTYICSLVCFSRSLSYLTYPPLSDTLLAGSIERLVPYFFWGCWLLILGSTLLVGAFAQSVPICFVAHLFTTLTYSFLFYSLTFSIVLNNIDENSATTKVGWAGDALIALFAILNGWRVWKLANDLKRKRP